MVSETTYAERRKCSIGAINENMKVLLNVAGKGARNASTSDRNFTYIRNYFSTANCLTCVLNYNTLISNDNTN